MAVRTWQRVISGFFPPEPLGLAGQEQVADLGDGEMFHQGVVLANLEMAQAQFVLFILQATLHGPACEADVQNDLDGARRVA